MVRRVGVRIFKDQQTFSTSRFILDYVLINSMQIQEQIEKILSFEEINPIFSRLMAENGGYMGIRDTLFESQKGATKYLGDCKTCVVGEAHGN